MSILPIFFPSAGPALLLPASRQSPLQLHRPSHFMTQFPTPMVCFCMSVFIYHPFFKFLFLSSTPEFTHRPVTTKISWEPAAPLAQGNLELGATLMPAMPLPGVSVLWGLSMVEGTRGLLTSISSPRQGEGWTRTEVQPGEEHRTGWREHPSLSPSQRDPSSPTIRQGWWSRLSWRRSPGLWEVGEVVSPVAWSGPAWPVGAFAFPHCWCTKLLLPPVLIPRLYFLQTNTF